jgi:phenylacetate-CoA ligase
VVALFRGKSTQIAGTVIPQTRTQGDTMSAARFPLEPIEKASIDELRALQLKRLQWPRCARLRQLAGLQGEVRRGRRAPDDCKTLADLAKFPFTTKKDLRDSYPFGMFAVPREQVVRIHASSGTTGKPTVVGYTQKDIDTWAGVVARSASAPRRAAGRHGACELRLRPVHRRPGRALRRREAGLLTVVPFGGGQTEKQVQLIQDFKPDIIMVTPSYMLAIADEFERQGIDPALSLRIGIFGAEPWTNDMRSAIERAWASTRWTSTA